MTPNSVLIAQKRVALKRLHFAQVEEFHAEASILLKCIHPNIIQLFGIFHKDNVDYLVTEYLPLGSIDRFLQEHEQTVTIMDIFKMAKDAAAGMLV